MNLIDKYNMIELTIEDNYEDKYWGLEDLYNNLKNKMFKITPLKKCETVNKRIYYQLTKEYDNYYKKYTYIMEAEIRSFEFSIGLEHIDNVKKYKGKEVYMFDANNYKFVIHDVNKSYIHRRKRLWN